MIKEAIKDLKELRNTYGSIPCGRGCAGCPLNLCTTDQSPDCIFWRIGEIELARRYRVEVHSYYYIDTNDVDSIYEEDASTKEVMNNLVITGIYEVCE